MTTINATFRVTTPMFCGGADPTSGAVELREASFKGVLRFWWRALAWPRLDGDPEAIRAEESRIFGGPDTGRSRVMVRLSTVDFRALRPPSVLRSAVGSDRAGARYLGYGLMHAARSRRAGIQEAELVRGCYESPFTFEATLRGRHLDDGGLSSVVEAVTLLGAIGGMGARSRRGYGSLSLASLTVDGDRPHALASLSDFRRFLGGLDLGRSGALPQYTALSPRARILVGEPCGGAMAALQILGSQYMEFRKDKVPIDRAVFGLPIVGKAPVGAVGHNRRASPLFFHVHECEGQAVPVVAFLPARFLPGQAPALAVGRQSRPLPSEHDLYRPVDEFLDNLTGFTKPEVPS